MINSNTFISIFTSISILEFGLAMCPNLCNGNGICSSDSVCSCFSGYTGPECSLRTCPFGLAWADKAYSKDSGHQYAECAGAGLCNQDSGVCECFPGYTGQACEKASCPNHCYDRGTCMTMADVASFYGQDYDTSLKNAGDGYGPTYANWDKAAGTLCSCDYGFFGPDCSNVMCPKGDDPMTDSQNYRQILLTVKDYAPFTGVLGVTFQGETTFISLSAPNSTDCETSFEAADKFEDVNCTFTAVRYNEITFDITFISWPKFPKENNLYVHSGNPSASEFTCDISRTDPNTLCTFTDVVNTNLREYEYCSNRGTCNFKTGECACVDGFGGFACERINNIFSHTTDTGVADQVIVRSPDFTSTAYNIKAARSSQPDFYLLESFSDSKQSFYVRGDGEVGALKARVWGTGLTVEQGGLTVEYGGLSVASDGVYVYNTDVTSPALSVQSTSESFTGDTLKFSTAATKTTAHNLIKGYSSGTAKFSVRGDGFVNVGDQGMLMTGALSVMNNGLQISDGVTVHSSGLKITGGMTIEGAVTVTGGVTVISTGLKVTGGMTVNGRMKVQTGGVLVSVGGQTVAAGGMAIVDGLTIAQAGLTVTGSLSVHSSGFKVTGGMSIFDLGLTIAGGLTVETAGMKVDSGGMSMYDGMKITDGLSVSDVGMTIYNGATVVDTGLVVNAGGLSIDSYGIFVTAGMTISTGGLVVVAGGSGVTGGVSVEDDGLKVTGGVTLHDTGLVVVAGGLSVQAGGVSVADGLTVQTGGLSVDASGLLSYQGFTVQDVGMKLTGGLTVHDLGLVVTADGSTIGGGGLKVENGVTVLSGGVLVDDGGVQVTGGLTVHDSGMKITGGVTLNDAGVMASANGVSIMGNGLKVEDGITMLDTGLSSTSAGMKVTGGLTLHDVGVKVDGGVTVDSGGLYVTVEGGTVSADGLTASGLTLLDAQLNVGAGGMQVTGGLSINDGGFAVPTGMGLTVEDTGLVVDLNGASVMAGTMTVTGGLTVTTSGLYVDNTGIDINGGLTVSSGGITFMNGAGLVVEDIGMEVSSGGANIYGGMKVAGGMTVESMDLAVFSNMETSGTTSVYSGGILYGGLTVNTLGLKVDSGGATFNGDVSVYGSMTVTGDVYCTNYIPSDRRLKYNIAPLKNSLNDVTKLRGVYFKWNEKSPVYNANSRRQLGLVAQDVETVYPELVHGIMDEDYKGVNYESLIPVLIEAVRELNGKYEDLNEFSHQLDTSTEGCER